MIKASPLLTRSRIAEGWLCFSDIPRLLEIISKVVFLLYSHAIQLMDDISPNALLFLFRFFGWWVFPPLVLCLRFEIGAGRAHSRFNRLNQSIYIQLGGFFFLSVSLRVGGGIRQVRALMILKWRGPELSDCVGTGRRWCRSLPPSSCFPLSLFSSVFIYRFIALHSYMHTRPHTWNAYRQQPFHFAGRNLPGRAISPFPALFLSCAVVIYLIVCYKAQDVGRRRRGRS